MRKAADVVPQGNVKSIHVFTSRIIIYWFIQSSVEHIVYPCFLFNVELVCEDEPSLFVPVVIVYRQILHFKNVLRRILYRVRICIDYDKHVFDTETTIYFQK